ncbi:MAG: molybdenum cofactor biosynthesis protein MoeB [Chitinophagaceae bacterium]|nr:MAG: molybdenum cofactor biosynthesis protein MoeB [Chitinophagaceae bacterium]
MRYSRHISLKNFGAVAQDKLLSASILVIGAGGLSSPALLYLAAAGVGTIGIIDNDTIDLSNLQRQILYNTNDVGGHKATTAEQKLNNINPEINIISYQERLTSINAIKIIGNYDLVLDGSDNFPTRYLVNDACALMNKPFIYGSVFRYEGEVAVFNYNDGPDYRDLVPSPPPPGSVPDCSEAGVLGVVTGIIGTMQALEAIKLITGVGDILSGKILHYNALTATSQIYTLKHRKDRLEITSLIDYESFCNPGIRTIFLSEYRALILSPGSYELIDVREQSEYDEFNIGGRLIPAAALNEALETLDKNKRFYVHCASGARALKAVTLLKEKGFEAIRVLL